ncbi:putative Major facilitator superfamily (MFS) profile domain-containing protein [Seiridium unicorne]|uniref:Major facilitator superfamily (MFS) profile domain-containing protein n=1 Tax=Seiridium unicorne TaxID=138068 RepID=A0ABR2UP54_9PEZI
MTQVREATPQMKESDSNINTPALSLETRGFQNNPDLEAAHRSSSEIKDTRKDPDLVTWDGPDDPEYPKNWATSNKWIVTILISAFNFISPVASTMAAPALTTIGADLGMQSEVEVEMALSIFVLAYTIGPLFFGPLSEVYGRSRVVQLSNLWFLAWNLGCGFAQNSAEMFVFRFLAGIGGSAPLAIGAGTLGDCWSPAERAKAVGIYMLTPLLGPVVGPIAGGFIAERTTWRWIFWSTSIVAGFIQACGFIWLRESHAPTLLKRKRDRLVKETGNNKFHLGDDADQTLFSTVGTALARPSRMLATQPIVQLVALYMAYCFGITYLIAVTFPVVWSELYGESLGIGGLNFISLGVGSILGVFLNVRFFDRICQHLKEKNNGVSLPEFRVPAMFFGSTLVPVGLFWYGWSVQGRVHWIMPNIGIAILTAGTMICLQSMQGYIIDTYTRFAASCTAAIVVLRSLAGFGFPLFAPCLYEKLDYGWGTSLLAFISIAIGIPAPVMFYVYGARLRAKSKFASG